MVLLMLTAACQQRTQTDPTQIVARMGESEISVHQLNALLRRTPEQPGVDPRDIQQKSLRLLIDQQLAADQAVKEKLNRTPDAVLTLEGARLQTLAQLYAVNFIRSQPPPAPSEVQRYYREHPELFAERRDYGLLMLTVSEPDAALAQRLRDAAAAGKAPDALSAQLTVEGKPFTLALTQLKADEISLPLAAVLAKREVGAVAIDDASEGQLSLLQVKSIKAAPRTSEQAQASIQQFLSAQNIKAALPRQIERLFQTASIQYFGDFAPPAATGTTAAAQP